MNVLFLNPPFLPKYSREQRSPAVTRSGTFYYPMWLTYAAGLLEKNGYTVNLMDCPARNQTIRDIEILLAEFKPRLVVVATSTPSIYKDIETSERIKELSPDTYIVMVGPHVTATADETMGSTDSVDAIARLEYDFTILEIAGLLKRGKIPNESVPGLTFRKDNRIIHNEDRAFIENLDDLPFVSEVYARHLRLEDYGYAHGKKPLVTINSGRGCPHKCIFCVYPATFQGRQYRVRSIENVVDELEYIQEKLPHVKEVMFEDDTLTINRKRLRAFCEEKIRRKLNIDWCANSRADLDLSTLKLMKKANARLVCVGFESAVPEVLEGMRKKNTLKKMENFCRDTKEAGMLVHGCFIAGAPGDTKDNFRKTVSWAKTMKLDSAQFFPIMVYPGSDLYGLWQKKGYIKSTNYAEWVNETGQHNTVVDTDQFTSEELLDICDDARLSFYLSPGYIARKLGQSISNPDEFMRNLSAARKLFKHIFIRTKKKLAT